VTHNAGNEALSSSWLRYLEYKAPQADIRVIDRCWSLSRAMGVASRPGLAGDPGPLVEQFERMVDRFIRRTEPDPSGKLAGGIREQAVAAPTQPRRKPLLLAKLIRLLRPRSRLAAAGLIGGTELRKVANTLAWAEVVIWNAAGEIYPTGEWEDLLRMLILLAAAQRLGAKIVVVNHSLETRDPRLDRLLAHVHAKSDLLFLRGKASMAKAIAIGLPGAKLIEAPDLVFRARLETGGGARERSGAIPPGAIVLALNGLSARNGIDEWERLLVGLGGVGRPLAFLSNSMLDDRDFIRRFDGRVAVTVIERQPGYAEMLQLFAPAALVVSSRLHSAILALCAGVPIVTIEGSDYKISEVVEQMNYPVPTEPVAIAGWADRVLRHVRDALDDRERLTVVGAEAVERQVARIDRAYRPLFDLLEGEGRS
jgi:polysaccharide pyruvyl transferase WcaK-like protein